MLPSESAAARSVVGVADDLFSALNGGGGTLPAASSVVLVVIDGLGALSLRAHSGHARTLSTAMTRKSVATSVFPSTTAAALTSILTGAWPGEHGLVGYQVRDPERDVPVNQLSGWESAGVDPVAWQTAPTIFERAVAEGRGAFAVGLAAYAHSGFSRATLRGSTFSSAGTARDRVGAAYELAERNPGSVVYCYLPEVDKAGHRHGVASGEWVAALEDIDAALSRSVPAGVGVLVTSDHGMLDVPADRQLILDETHLRGVRWLAGEPRMIHAYVEPDASPTEVADRWRADLDGLADVATRQDAVDAGLFGPRVTPDSAARIGDLIAVPRGNRAIYDGTAADQRARGMIGQHGGLTPEERQVPSIALGAFAR
ncbi:alkaline phosphatase family protein [uncultured Microbacterium sp.]|uniref:alkaline phosphatase family protein n=1 Tax=uncultured Microbacterium sp. TaxID=191216 RepID=UPI0028DB8464|nr:alkaline phosphatase family protein [uncultured Microbacterium sp.]